jgi:hypothetical protein
MEVFGSVVTVTFQSVFRFVMHQTSVFLFLKIILTSTHQNDKKTLKKLI